ncbi:hypothetical protein BD324DRAFT_639994 [Kockovaella imperatae]|uniref:Uncharacterized protein n=1 Tax=Kockovaella imperatae TaxID=4999 RepID=A0A1Y1U5Y5_9TREE|nr:hypothetical protein BD324DRAFT_639994 [Kockovaella imperatae]ORX33402.1 hypothetical protein BD324DRAFT_639994 [Kockovaella imperatae]
MVVMMTPLTIKTTHPALFATGLATPPMSPNTPVKSKPVIPTAPIVSYAQLRKFHVTALNYQIAKLRWEQNNGGYLKGEDAWLGHNNVIAKLEKELKDVQEAQKGLDRFPNCFAPTAFPKPHGPPSKEQLDEERKLKAEETKVMDAELDAQFPFIKQMFIGPRTKQQAKNDRMLRDLMKEGDFDDLSMLLPSKNMRMLMEGQAKKAGGAPPPPSGGPKKTYEQVRLEKEAEKVAAMRKESPSGGAAKKPRAPRIGPLTREEWIATLPRFGPITKAEAMLPAQREQRHAILTWLRKPWPVFDPDAADLMVDLGRLAVRKLDQETKAVKKLREVTR